MKMMKRSLMSAMAVLSIIIFALTSCSKDDSADLGYNRVVLLYFAANNNLSTYASNNITSLEDGFLPEEDSEDILLVYSHLYGEDPVLLRFYKDNSGTAHQDVVANYPEQNSTTPEVLEAVLNKIGIIFPAKEYGVILWSHGTGWLPDGYYENPGQYGVNFPDPYAGIVKSFGDESGIEMDIKDLNEAIPYHLSFLIFDCCLMGGIEVAYEVKDKCDYIIASPAEILATGFPYDQIMEPIFERKADLNEVCQRYYDFYNAQSGIYKSATVALYKSDKLDELAVACKTIFENSRTAISNLNVSKVQGYYRLNKHWFYDLTDFVSQVASASELAIFNTAINDAVIGKWTTPSFLDFTISDYSGISTYVQSNGTTYLDSYYKGYKWNIATEMIK